MVSSDTVRRGARTAAVIVGFLGGFLIVAGVYGVVFPERLVERGIASVSASYAVSAALVAAGVAGLYLQRQVRRRLLDE
jgi:protein-S-isoprenylcysteine O-methyltransferase Ste14